MLMRLAVQGSYGDPVQEFKVEANVARPSSVRRPPEPPFTSSTPPGSADFLGGRVRPPDGMGCIPSTSPQALY